MAEETGITWADATFNPVIGCTKVGPGCAHCYAARDNERFKWVPAWGDGNRRLTKTWGEPRKWNARHAEFFAKHGRKRRVFAASLADVFDNQWEPKWRFDFFELVEETLFLEWYIVTKRISNAAKMLPEILERLGLKKIPNMVLIITVVTQPEADRDIPRLIELKRKYPWLRIGLSIEPMLEAMTIGEWVRDLDWVIVGGESEGKPGEARPFHPKWADLVRRECKEAGVPFHLKQMGHNRTYTPGMTDKGKDMTEWPAQLRVRQFPREAA